MLADSYRPLIALQLKDKEIEQKKKPGRAVERPALRGASAPELPQPARRSSAAWGTRFPGRTPRSALPGCLSARPRRTELGFQPAGREQAPDAPRGSPGCRTRPAAAPALQAASPEGAGGTPPRCSREHRKSRQRCHSKKAAGRREGGGLERGCRSWGGAAGAAGGQRPPESGPRPFLGCRLPGKQRVNDRVRSLAKLRPLRAGGSSRDPTARSGEGTSPPARGDTGRDPRPRAGISGGGLGLAAARSAAALRD